MRFLLLFIMISFSCKSSIKKNLNIKSDKVINNNATDINYTFTDTILKNKILDTLSKLFIIIRENKFIDSFTNHKHSIEFLINDPEKNDSDIFIQAGFDENDRFETHYQIYINPKTMDIKFYDPVDDKKLSIKEYEKWEAGFK